jgi:ATP/maltotriose-dependent transcriptional regulator MalT
LTIFKSIQNFTKWAAVLNNISALHWQRENKIKSKDYARQAIAISKKHNIESELISGKINLANVLKEQDSVRQAIVLYNDVIRRCVRNGDLSTLANSKNNLAICYGILGETEEELATYREVVNLYSQSGNEQYLSAVWLNIASTFYKLGSLDSTLAYAKMAESNARKFNKSEYLEPIFKQLSSVYKDLNNFDSSIYYKDAILTLRDSLNAEREELTMHALEEKFQNKELKGDLSKSKKESEKTASYLKKVLIILGIALLLLAVSLLLIRVWSKRSKKLTTVVVEKEVQLESLQEVVTVKDQEIEELQFVKEKKKLPYPSNLTPLTNREKEVLEKASKGLKDQEIADELFLSINTVRTHMRKLFVKIDARNRAEAIQFFNEYDLG